MIKVTDKNRQEILEHYAESILNSQGNRKSWLMRHSGTAFAINLIMRDKNLMSNESLESEILEFFPEILED